MTGRRGVVALVAALAFACLGSPATAAAPQPYAKVGDCVYHPGLGLMMNGRVVPCSKLHDGEVIAVLKDLPRNWPIPSRLGAVIGDTFFQYMFAKCGTLDWDRQFGVPVDWPTLGALQVSWDLPSDSQWRAGARWAICQVTRVAYSPRTVSIVRWSGGVRQLVSQRKVTKLFECIVKKPSREPGGYLVHCDSQQAQWLRITNFTPTTGTEDGDCAEAAARLTAPDVPVEYAHKLIDYGGDQVYANCFIPLANWRGLG